MTGPEGIAEHFCLRFFAIFENNYFPRVDIITIGNAREKLIFLSIFLNFEFQYFSEVSYQN